MHCVICGLEVTASSLIFLISNHSIKSPLGMAASLGELLLVVRSSKYLRKRSIDIMI